MRGAKRKPTPIKKLEGNLGNRPLPENEPPTIEDPNDCPEELDGEARLEWFRVVADMNYLNIMSREYRPALIMYCDTWAEFIKCKNAYKEMGPITKTMNGNYVQNPLLGSVNKLKREARAWLVEFGMTPTSKSRLNMENHGSVDDFDEYIKLAETGSYPQK